MDSITVFDNFDFMYRQNVEKFAIINHKGFSQTTISLLGSLAAKARFSWHFCQPYLLRCKAKVPSLGLSNVQI